MNPDQLFSSLKKDVRSLLISTKHGLSPEQLKKDYQNMLGYPMPLKVLGFRTILDMAKEMPDAVRLDYGHDGSWVLKAVGDETTRGIEQLVSKQRDQKPKKKSGSSRFSRSSLHQQRSFTPLRRGMAPPALPVQLRSQLRQLLAHGPIRLSELETRYVAWFGRPLCVMQYGFYSIAEMLAAASDLITARQTRMGSQLMLKTEITAAKPRPDTSVALLKHSAGTTSLPQVSPCSVLREKLVLGNVQTEIQKRSQNPADVKAEETEPAASVPANVKKGMVFEKSIAKLEEELKQRILESEDAGTISVELKDKLRKVVAKHSNGLAIQNLPTEYKKMYGENMPLAQWGFLSITEMVGALSDTFYLQPSSEDGGKHLVIRECSPNDQPDSSRVEQGPSAELLNFSGAGHYSSYTQSAWEQQNNDDEESDTEIRITNRTVHQMVNVFPETLLSRGSILPLDALQCQKLKPPTRRRERELLPVLVVKVESPSYFYICIDENKEARMLENIMIEMRSCYSCPEVAARYRLPDAYLRPGQVCCLADRNKWFYRVVIHRVINATEVVVYYVDFGDLITVNRNSLQFLKSCYAELPAQAVPAVLVGIKPVKGFWTEEATSMFQMMCDNRTLVAAVHSYQQNFLLLFLCDTHTEEDVYIHKALQDEGHAAACSAATTPVLQKLNPVTLYLGEGQLEEVKHFTTLSSSLGGQSVELQHQPDTSTVLTDVADKQQPRQEMCLLDLPELELIDLDQGEKMKCYEELLSRDSASYSNWEQGWTDKSNDDDVSKQISNCQKENTNAVLLSPVVNDEPVLKTLTVSESKTSEVSETSQNATSTYTSALTRTCSRNTGKAAVSVHPLHSSLFPVFSSGLRTASDGLFLRHATSFALGPSARMATGPNLLHWYSQNQTGTH